MNTTPPAAMNINRTCASSASKSRARIAALVLVSHFLLPISLAAAETAPPSGNVAPKTTHTEDDGDRITIARGKFSDTATPGTLKIEIPYRKLEIKGTSGDEIVIISELDQKGKPRVDAEGFRRLDENGTFDLVEKDNVAVLKPGNDSSWQSGSTAKFKIYLPWNTNLSILEAANFTTSPKSGKLSAIFGDIEIKEIKGSLEITGRDSGTLPGSIELEDVSGAITITTCRPKIDIEFNHSPQNPISITATARPQNPPTASTKEAMNIKLELPSEAQATFLFRTNSAKIRTNFPEERFNLVSAAPVKETSSRNRAFFLSTQTGLLNGGGVDIQISTDAGNITIKEDD